MPPADTPTPLKWTRTPPTEAGWYWIRLSNNQQAFLVADVFTIDPFAVPPHGRPRLNAVFFEPGGEDCYYEMDDPEFRGAEWAGPIPPPEEGS